MDVCLPSQITVIQWKWSTAVASRCPTLKKALAKASTYVLPYMRRSTFVSIAFNSLLQSHCPYKCSYEMSYDTKCFHPTYLLDALPKFPRMLDQQTWQLQLIYPFSEIYWPRNLNLHAFQSSYLKIWCLIPQSSIRLHFSRLPNHHPPFRGLCRVLDASVQPNTFYFASINSSEKYTYHRKTMSKSRGTWSEFKLAGSMLFLQGPDSMTSDDSMVPHRVWKSSNVRITGDMNL